MEKRRRTKKIVFGSIIVFLVVLTVILILRFFFFGSEDTWIRDEKGVYVKHGNPSSTPEEVENQQKVIKAAVQIYNSKKIVGMEFSSQCLGSVEGYAIDIVHVPRNAEDDLPENQCDDFKTGKVTHFIELDKNGEVVRIV
jgi:hypothetical protein